MIAPLQCLASAQGNISAPRLSLEHTLLVHSTDSDQPRTCQSDVHPEVFPSKDESARSATQTSIQGPRLFTCTLLIPRQKLGHRRRGRMNNDDPARQHRSGASTSTTISTAARKARFLQQSQSDGQLRHNRTKHRHNHHGSSYGQPRHNHHQYQQQQQQQNRPPSTHAVVLPQGGGLILVGEDGVRKSKFPRGCERPPGSGGAAGKRAEAVTVSITEQSTAGSGGKEDVLTRLCNPKHFTGTAATGHLPTVVDLEGGVGVSCDTRFLLIVHQFFSGCEGLGLLERLPVPGWWNSSTVLSFCLVSLIDVQHIH